MKRETSNQRRPANLRVPLFHSIFWIDPTPRTQRLWAVLVCRISTLNLTKSKSTADFPVVKNKRNEKAAKFSVPLPKVRGIAEEEMFKVKMLWK